MRAVLLGSVVCVFLAVQARADVILLRDGEKVHGVVVGGDDDRTFIRLDAGGTRCVPSKDVVRIEKRLDASTPGKASPPESGATAGTPATTPAKAVPCPSCSGTGKSACGLCKPCGKCLGGKVTCPRCLGKPESECDRCLGEGIVVKTRPKLVVGAGGGQSEEIVISKCGKCNGKRALRCGGCDGKGHRKCGSCGGSGLARDCAVCRGTKKARCSMCEGKGRIEAGALEATATGALVMSLRRSVVLLEARGAGTSVSTGSGFIVSSRGHVVTNLHVVDGAQSIYGHWDPTTRRAAEQLVVVADGRARGHDLALLAPAAQKGTYEPLRLCDEYRLGTSVVVAGFPMSGLLSGALGTQPADLVITRGGIASVRSDDKGAVKFLQTDAAAANGCSGGPLIDVERGAVVGVITFAYDPARGQGVGEVMEFAIPTSAIIECFETELSQSR